MTRVFPAMMASLVLLAATLGVPWLLLRWGQLTVLVQINWATLTRPDDGQFILALLTLVGWLAWAVFAAATMAEFIQAISRGRRRIAIPGIRWLRPLVGALVATALSPLLTAHAHAVTAEDTAAAVSPAIVQTVPDDAAPDEPPDATTPWRDYQVQLGDELWDISERLLGSGERWRQLAAANPEVDIDAPLIPGTVLRVPVTLTVEPGDSLWDLAEEHLQDPERWPDLQAANADLVTDPNQIDVGWVLTLPGADVATHTVAENPEHSPQAIETAPPPTPQPGPPRSPTVSSTPDEAGDHLEATQLLGPIGGLLAAGIVAGVSLRRRGSLHQRALGQRIRPWAPQLASFWTALGQRNAEYWVAGPTERPPTTVLLGWHHDERELWHDLEQGRCLWVSGSKPAVLGVAASIWTSLLCAQWSTQVDVVAVHPEEPWEQAIDDPRLRVCSTTAQALNQLRTLCAKRRVAMRTSTLEQRRTDPDLGPALNPTVFIFLEPLSDSDAQQVVDALDLGPVGVSVVAPMLLRPPRCGHHLILNGQDQGVLDGGPTFTPQSISEPARHAVVELFASSIDPGTDPAPWWVGDSHPGDDTALPGSPSAKEAAMAPDTPTLLLLGEVELLNAAGEKPNRAVGRCLESCAWLLAHPGATPSQMRDSLMVAESTRRSNMSRLRAWLGRGPAGEHLPDAYSGRIQLADTVSSDWERFQFLLAGGVDRASSPLLHEALAMVRGSPLGSFGFQWNWAETLRMDMISMIVDASAVLTDRCLKDQDYEMAHWALSQGMLAAGDVEPLVARRIRLLAQQGQRDEVDRQVLQLTRTARAAGRDLAEDSVEIIQEALSLSRR